MLVDTVKVKNLHQYPLFNFTIIGFKGLKFLSTFVNYNSKICLQKKDP